MLILGLYVDNLIINLPQSDEQVGHLSLMPVAFYFVFGARVSAGEARVKTTVLSGW